MDLQSICDLIDLPAAVKKELLASAQLQELAQAESLRPLLLGPATWGDGIDAVAATLGDDPGGTKMLAFLLQQAAQTYEDYGAKSIDDTIFAATMKFCTRCVLDHYRSYGTYAFVAERWFPRQLSLLLLRIGELEYEVINEGGNRKISIHIPSDAKFDREGLLQSYHRAREVIAGVHPEFADVQMSCDSWLLSPILRTLLPERSNILLFQSAFDIVEVDTDDSSSLRWVFGRDDIPPAELPESTSLQRGIKTLLLSGGKVGSAVGNLRTDPWTEVATQ